METGISHFAAKFGQNKLLGPEHRMVRGPIEIEKRLKESLFISTSVSLLIMFDRQVLT